MYDNLANNISICHHMRIFIFFLIYLPLYAIYLMLKKISDNWQRLKLIVIQFFAFFKIAQVPWGTQNSFYFYFLG